MSDYTPYYPSMIANLRLSFDPTLTIPTTAPDLWSIDSALAAPATPARVKSEPLAIAKGPASYILNRVPSAATIQLPGHRPAGRFTLSFPFKDLPIDPRTVQSCAVDVYVGTVLASNFARGMAGEAPFGVKLSVLDTTEFFGDTSNLVISGMVDEWQVAHKDDGDIVTIMGRDLRGILIDTPVHTDQKTSDKVLHSLDHNLPIQLVIEQLYKTHPLTERIKIRTSLSEWPGGIPPAPGGRAMPRHRKGAKGKKTGGTAGSSSKASKLSFWDVTVQLCYLVGAIPSFVGSELHIRPSRSLFDQALVQFDPSRPTPFKDAQPRARDAVSGKAFPKPITARRMVYGRDIESLTFDRKFGGFRKPRQVRCVNADATVEGKYPSNEIASRLVASGQKAMADILWVPVHEIDDEKRLTEIAQAVYEEIGRGEIGGTVSTKALSSFGGDNRDPDLLRLRPGDAIEFATDVRTLARQAPLVSEFTDHMRKSFNTQVADVAKRIGDVNLSRVIISTARGIINELQNFYRVSAVTFGWSVDGLQVGFDFQNYVVKSFDKDGSRNKSGGVVTEVVVPGQGFKR